MKRWILAALAVCLAGSLAFGPLAHAQNPFADAEKVLKEKAAKLAADKAKAEAAAAAAKAKAAETPKGAPLAQATAAVQTAAAGKGKPAKISAADFNTASFPAVVAKARQLAAECTAHAPQGAQSSCSYQCGSTADALEKIHSAAMMQNGISLCVQGYNAYVDSLSAVATPTVAPAASKVATKTAAPIDSKDPLVAKCVKGEEQLAKYYDCSCLAAVAPQLRADAADESFKSRQRYLPLREKQLADLKARRDAATTPSQKEQFNKAIAGAEAQVAELKAPVDPMKIDSSILALRLEISKQCRSPTGLRDQTYNACKSSYSSGSQKVANPEGYCSCAGEKVGGAWASGSLARMSQQAVIDATVQAYGSCSKN